MPYYMRTTSAGKTREVEKWKKAPRAQGIEGIQKLPPPTAEDITRINRANALRRLRQTLNNNFGVGDIWVTFTYHKLDKAGNKTHITHEMALSHYPKLMRDLRKLYAAEGIPLRYLAVTEQRRTHRPHHHIALPELSTKKLQALWPYGHINLRPFDATGQYHRLAIYIIEHSDTPAQVGDRWKCSQNLTRPEPSKTKTIKAKNWRVSVPNGWELDKIVPPEQGTNPFTGMKYLRYTLIKIEPKRRC